MSVKQPPAGGGTGDTSGGSDGGGGGATGDFGGINGLIVRDVDALLRYGAMFKAVADKWRSFANGLAEFSRFQPLKRGVSDETWNTYSPSYFKVSDDMLDVLFKASDGWDSAGEKLKAFALLAQRGEENATDHGHQLGKHFESPGSTQGSAFRPVEERGPGGANRLVGRVVKLPDGSSKYVVDESFRPVEERGPGGANRLVGRVVKLPDGSSKYVVDDSLDPPVQQVFTKSVGAPILPPDQDDPAPERTTLWGKREDVVDYSVNPPVQQVFTKSVGAPILPPDQDDPAPERTTLWGKLEPAVKQSPSTDSDGSAQTR